MCLGALFKVISPTQSHLIPHENLAKEISFHPLWRQSPKLREVAEFAPGHKTEKRKSCGLVLEFLVCQVAPQPLCVSPLCVHAPGYKSLQHLSVADTGRGCRSPSPPVI